MRGRLRKELLKRDGNLCHYCLKPCHCKDPRHKDYATIDHKTPRSRGGLLVDENLVIACLQCNQRKGARTEEEFMEVLKCKSLT